MKPPLLLGIDASRSSRVCPTGVERYSTEIIRALLKEVGDEVEVRLYTPRVIEAFPREVQRVLRSPRLWSVVRLSWEMLWHKPDVLFVPAHVLPFFAPRRSFVTLHDVAFKKVPDAYGWFARWYLNWSTRRAVRRCERIFVPSEAVKADLERLFGARAVTVVPHGPLEVTPVEVTRWESPLFFFLGRIEAKKNLSTLLEAWEIVQKKYSTGRLVLAGSPGEGYDDLREKAQGLAGVIFTGFVSESEASWLFHSATAFVFPSLEEGFGLPLLQAFSADCPVICSDIPALREVGGEAPVFVPAQDSAAWAAALERIVVDGAREELAARGRDRLKAFSWEKAGREMLRIFKG